MTLNVVTENEWWLWTPIGKTGISECQTEKNDSKRRNWEEMVALNAKLEMWLWTPNWKHGSEDQTEKIWWLWTPNWRRWRLWTSNYKGIVTLNAKLKRDGGSERLTEERHGGSEHPNWERMVTLNVELEMQFWTPNWRRWRLWTP